MFDVSFPFPSWVGAGVPAEGMRAGARSGLTTKERPGICTTKGRSGLQPPISHHGFHLQLLHLQQNGPPLVISESVPILLRRAVADVRIAP